MARETAEQRARRELAALEKKGQTPSRATGGRGKPAISNAELQKREEARLLKEFKRTRVPAAKIVEQAKPKTTSAPPSPPRERGVAAGQSVRTTASRAVTPVVRPAKTAVQTTAGFMEGLGIKPTKRGLIKSAIALGASYLGYKGFEAWQDSNKPAPTPTKGVAPTQSPQRAAPPAKPAEEPKKESEGMLIGMSTKQLEGQFKKARVKNRYTA